MKVKSESEGTDLGTQKKADRGTANWSVTKYRSGSEEEEQSFQPAVLKGLNIHKKKNKAWPKPYFSYKITSKYVGLNVKSKTIKLLKENIKGNLWVLGFGEEF